MAKNATVSIYIPTNAANSEGTPIKTWGYKQTPAGSPAATFRGDVQPKQLREAEIQLWGLSNRSVDTKELIIHGRVPSLSIGNRAAVTEDGEGVTRYYDILGVNPWRHHSECTLVPVQGE